MIIGTKPFAVALVATSTCLFTGTVLAASQCVTIDNSVTAAGTFPGNSCPGGKAGAINKGLTPTCGGNITPNADGAYIFKIPVGASNSGLTFKVVSTQAGFNPEMEFMASPCDSDPNGGACTIDQTNGTQTVGPFAPSPATPAAGTYYLVVTDLAPGDNPGCGAFNLTVVGTLPVKLQDFSIQ